VGSSARYVRVQLAGSGILSLAEVQVFGVPGTTQPPVTEAPVNQALAGVASQSSTGVSAGIQGLASLAIDGDTNGRYRSGSASRTVFNEAQPWWQVELVQNTDVDRVVLFNRTDDCCSADLADVHVFVSASPFADGASLAELQADPDVWHTYLAGVQGRTTTVTVGSSARYVRVQLAGSGCCGIGCVSEQRDSERN